MDLEKILCACEQLRAPARIEELSRQVLAALRPVFPSMYYSWELLRAADAKSISASCVDDRGPVDWSAVSEPYRIYTPQHPFVPAALVARESQVCVRSDLLSDRRWERTDFYNLVLRPLGVRDQLALSVRNEAALGVLVFHQNHAVDERSRQALKMLAPHVVQAIKAAFQWEVSGQDKAGGNWHGRVVLDFTGRVVDADARAENIFQVCFPEKRSQGLPGRVRRWFEPAARATTAEWSAAGMRQTRLATIAGPLKLTLLTDFAVRRHVVLVEARPSPKTDEGAALTAREREVLRWIAEGKRNAEIATIAGCSALTVKTHVENILRKLGAETRGAAAAMWRGGILILLGAMTDLLELAVSWA